VKALLKETTGEPHAINAQLHSVPTRHSVVHRIAYYSGCFYYLLYFQPELITFRISFCSYPLPLPPLMYIPADLTPCYPRSTYMHTFILSSLGSTNLYNCNIFICQSNISAAGAFNCRYSLLHPDRRHSCLSIPVWGNKRNAVRLIP
jgi:hypothetical protein